MLKALSIKNIAVIENVNIDFSEGFNILTGETGAGKSIIIDSLNMIKGERVSKSIIRNGETRAKVDAMFDVSDEISGWLSEEFGIENDGELLVSREITSDGKGSVRVNGTPVLLSMLKSIGEKLINIHGQHDNTSLLSPKTHIHFLDSYGGDEISNALEAYRVLHREYKDIRSEIEKIDLDEREALRRADMLKYQIDEIDMTALVPGEDAELEARKAILENSLKIATSTNKAYASLYEGGDYGTSAYDALWSALNAIEGIIHFDKALEETYAALSDASDAISEGARFLKSYCDNVDSSGYELDETENRLEQIHTLKIKYGNTIEEILEKRDEFQSELDSINGSGERLEQLKSKLEKVGKQREKAALALTELRKKCAVGLNKEITRELSELNMPNVVFDTVFKQSDFKSDGADDVEFVICTNAGEGLKPLAAIASGGELSRIMLAIKSTLAECDGAELLIFDEIDTGVSGATAQKIGEKLWKMSRYAQVMCITHLPQIAAMADHHYFIQKHSGGGRTRTEVALLNDEQRISEVARALGGTSVSDAAKSNAEELIRLAEKFKCHGGEK